MPDSAPPTVSGLPAEKLIAAALSSTPVSSPAFAWVPPSVEEVAPWFPDYEIQSLAGRGAMGAVYRAVQRKLERPVAIKLLPAELAARDGVETRFVREARALALLNHPGIVALHDYGRTDGGHLFIVMEYVDGTDLSRLIHAEGGGLSVEHALEIVGQVCDALQYAHSRGFVHRDIKPGNVLVDKEGRVKIADFGLAKLQVGVPPSGGSGTDGRLQAGPQLTQTGQALGTPDYTAPEQLKGGPVDHRADIYSLGVMFYEMLTGELPRGAWPPPSQCTAAPSRLDEVVTRAMQTEPANRYQQASEVKDAVSGAAILTVTQPNTAPAPSDRYKRIVIAVFLAFAAAWAIGVNPMNGLLLWAPPALLILCILLWPRRLPLSLHWGAATVAGGLFVMGLFFRSGMFVSTFEVEVHEKQRQLRDAEAELNALLVEYGPKHPRVQKAQAILDALRSGKRGEPSEQSSPTTVSGMSISALQDGRLEKLGVVEGQNVLQGDLVALMDSTAIKIELEALKRSIIERLTLEIRQGEVETLKLESELRANQLSEAEDIAAVKELTEVVKNASDLLSERPQLKLMEPTEVQRARLEVQKANARLPVTASHRAEIQHSLEQLKARMQEPVKTLAALQPVELTDQNIVPLLPLAAEERNRRDAILLRLDYCGLKSPCVGKVQSIRKQPGEFLKAGEPLLQIIPVATAAEAPAK